VRRQRLETTLLPAPNLDSPKTKRARKTRPLQHGAGGRHQQPDLTSCYLLERFDALARDFQVRLDLAKAFTRRIERDLTGILGKRCEVGEPAFRVRKGLSDDNEKATLSGSTDERGGEGGVTGARKPGDREAVAGRRKGIPDACVNRERFERVEDARQRHATSPSAGRPQRRPTPAAARRARG
jgi:hypothetical protein